MEHSKKAQLEVLYNKKIVFVKNLSDRLQVRGLHEGYK